MEHSASDQLLEARDVETSVMKFKKILYVGTLMASLLFGAQAFARGGGGGGGGHGGGFGGGGFTGVGTSYGGAVTRGSSYGGVGASAGAGLPQTGLGARPFGHRIGSGYGYGYGYGWGGYGYGYDSGAFYGNGLTYQPVDDALPKYERDQDKERASLPDSAFVKTYGTVRQAASKRSATY